MEFSLLGTKECIRVFPDAKGIYVPPEIKHGHPDRLKGWYEERNQEGAGVFFSVNETDGAGAAAENIIRIRTYYTDIDGLHTEGQKAHKLLEIMQAPLPPSAIVSTRNGLHCYWYTHSTKEFDASEYARTNLGIAQRFGGDESVKDVARVLRLPGTKHMKNPKEPYLIEVLHDLGWQWRYSQAEIREAYKPPEKKVIPKAARETTDNPRVWDMILSDFSKWTPIQGQRNLAMLLAAGVAIKFGISEGDAYHDLIPIVESWGLERDVDRELKRVIKWAYRKGEPTSVAALRNLGVHIGPLPRPEEDNWNRYTR